MIPNFMVAGVAKGGTTSLYYYLTQHPEVDIPRKETFYFTREFYKNIPGDGPPYFREKSKIIFSEEEYDKFYEKCNKKAIGEVSTCNYYFHKNSIPLIKKKLGDIKIIFLLRNPIERAFSAYTHFLRLGREPLTFKEAIQQEKIRMEKHWDFMWYYCDLGFYADSVKAFNENFSDVKFYLTEDLANEPQMVMKEVFQFIKVDDSFKPDTSFRYNISNARQDKFRFHYFFNNPVSRRFLKPVLKKMISEKKRRSLKHRWRKPAETANITLEPAVKKELKNLYRDDILELEKIINRDLSKWLE